MYNQGMVAYDTIIQQNTECTMVIHDFALVFLNDSLIGTFDRSKAKQHKFDVKC